MTDNNLLFASALMQLAQTGRLDVDTHEQLEELITPENKEEKKSTGSERTVKR